MKFKSYKSKVEEKWTYCSLSQLPIFVILKGNTIEMSINVGNIPRVKIFFILQDMLIVLTKAWRVGRILAEKDTNVQQLYGNKFEACRQAILEIIEGIDEKIKIRAWAGIEYKFCSKKKKQ